jgi:hypothetical protein
VTALPRPETKSGSFPSNKPEKGAGPHHRLEACARSLYIFAVILSPFEGEKGCCGAQERVLCQLAFRGERLGICQCCKSLAADLFHFGSCSPRNRITGCWARSRRPLLRAVSCSEFIIARLRRRADKGPPLGAQKKGRRSPPVRGRELRQKNVQTPVTGWPVPPEAATKRRSSLPSRSEDPRIREYVGSCRPSG